MAYEINFNNPYRISKPKSSSAPNKFEIGLKVVANEASDSSNIDLILKTLKDVCSIIAKTTNRAVSGTIAKFSFFSNTLKVFGIAKNVHKLYTEIQKKLPLDPNIRSERLRKKRFSIASSATGITAGMLTIPFLLQSLGAFTLTKISNAMKAVPVLGVIAKIYPISTVLSAIALLQLSISLADSINKLKIHKKKIERADIKTRFWESPLTTKGLSEKIALKQLELTSLKEKAEQLKNEFLDSEEEFNQINLALGKERALNYKDLSLKDYWKAKRQLNALTRRSQDQANRCQNLFDHYVEVMDKRAVLQEKCDEFKILSKSFHRLTSSDIQKLSEDKLAKWKTKHKIAKLDKLETASQIAIKTVIIISIIASLILTGTGVSFLSITLITLSLTLLTHTASLGVKWGFKYGKPKYQPVKFSKRFENIFKEQEATSQLYRSLPQQDSVVADLVPLELP